MPKFKFEKLVRDKIVKKQIASGAKPTYHQLDPENHRRELINKIIEEAKEIHTATPDEIVSEIADVQQALDDLVIKLKLTKQDVAKAQKLKNDKNGGFEKGHYIDYVEVNETDDWTKYYRQNPDRYPEIK